MVYGYHVILTTYGFWLPNDPRGSWSEWIRSWELRQYGRATKTDSRRSVASNTRPAGWAKRAKASLRYKPVQLTGIQARDIAEGMATAMTQGGYRCRSFAIMPDHVHLAVMRNERLSERMIQHLKSAGSRKIAAAGRHPFAAFRTPVYLPSLWSRGSWTVYLDSDEDLHRSIAYVENNPLKQGLPPQRWSFVERGDN